MRTFFEKYLHNSITLCILLAFALNTIIESLGRRSFFQCIDYLLDSPMTFLYNTLIIFLTFSIAFIVKRRTFIYVVVCILWLSLGITNGVLLGFRTTPFTVTDLSLLESVVSIIPNYLSTVQIILAIAAAVLIIISLIVAFIFLPKHKQKISYKKSVVGLIILAVSMMGITNVAIDRNWVSTYFDNLGYAYKSYGFPYCFINTWLNTGISAPRGYSNVYMNSIFLPGELPENLVSMPTDATADSERTPNIVMLQLESFFDPNLVEGVTFSKDPVPNFRRLKEKYSSGYLTVPVIGAGTANTEFEVLSGMSVRFFGPGEYPYKSVLTDDTCETINYDLKRLGYSTHAIHNHRGAFYGRNKVFSNLGFDTFTSLEYMNNVVKTPKNWAKDGVLTGEIISALESTENEDFVYTISVQGHGQYPTDKIIEELEITVEGVPEGTDANAFEYYLQQVREMDIFIGELVKELEAFDEDVVLVMYGDHLPSLNLSGMDLVNNTVYQTEYVMWSNFSMKENDMDLHSYQLSADVLNRLGISEGVIAAYHQMHSQDTTYLAKLKALQYDMLYGRNYIFNGVNPYKPTDLKMGVKEIKVDDIIKIGEKYYIKGQNFTPFSKISIGDKVLDTIFLGSTILSLLEEVDTDDITKMKVSQVEKNNEILSTTE